MVPARGQHPYRAALDNVVEVYQAVLRPGTPADKMVLAGAPPARLRSCRRCSGCVTTPVRFAARAEAELERRAQRFSAAGVRVDQKLLYGKRVLEIVRDARERKVDLIVMSSHKIDPAAAAQSLGTLSYQVSILCDCPVLLVK